MKHLDRRQFLKQSVQGTTALLASTPFLSSAQETKAQSANNKIVLALIGAGGRGSGLAKGLSGTGSVDFKYICDVNASRGVELIRDLEKQQSRAPKRIVDMREIGRAHV